MLVNDKLTHHFVDLEKLAKVYHVDRLFIHYRGGTTFIPVKKDFYIPLKCYVAYSYDVNPTRLYISNRLIGVGNYWLVQLQDDVKNSRIDLTVYQEVRKEITNER